MFNIILEFTSQNPRTTVFIKLSDIPPLLRIQNINYELRGICSLTGNVSSVGHYKAYCRRVSNSWEIYDDLAVKSIPIKCETTVQCEYLYYTI